MKALTEFLNASQARHSHLCPRQVLGVRVALAGCRLLNIEPALKRRRTLLVIAETDGCFVDGIEVTAQVSVGHRSLRVEDYGKIAATFVDTHTGRAVRVHPVHNVREVAKEYLPHEKRAYFAQLKGYQIIPDSEMLRAAWVTLNRDISQILGSPKQRSRCAQCGEEIINGREVIKGELIQCMTCAGETYYHLQEDTEILQTLNTLASIALR